MTTLFFHDDVDAKKSSARKRIFLRAVILPLIMILLMGGICIKAAHYSNTSQTQAADSGKSKEKNVSECKEEDDAYFYQAIPVRIMEFIR